MSGEQHQTLDEFREAFAGRTLKPLTDFVMTSKTGRATAVHFNDVETGDLIRVEAFLNGLVATVIRVPDSGSQPDGGQA